ncbi:MAG TPA: FkbM family methyltransferase [Verrucomicrobiae bacterium]|nr:FkbM family methyltransferase [Verrucomicrobiae bacterium]
MRLQATAARAASLLAKNPSLFCRLLFAKLNTARPMPPLPARRRIGGVLFEYDLEHYRGTAPMYFGSYSLLVVQAMERILRPGDVFIDVGANIGYLSAVAAGLVGVGGAVHAFEPVPAYFAKLQKLVALNPAHSITANACAVGDVQGAATIHVTHEPGQSTLVRGYKTAPQIAARMEVPLERLDSYFECHSIDRPALIKIDAEGFEFPALRGLAGYFRASAHRPPIICEIAPRAYSLLGRGLADLARFMADFGYLACDLIDGETPVDIRALDHVEDVLFVAKGE